MSKKVTAMETTIVTSSKQDLVDMHNHINKKPVINSPRLQHKMERDPIVPTTRKIDFLLWVFSIMVVQIWRDMRLRRWFRPIQKDDLAGHYFTFALTHQLQYVPIGRQNPRILLSAPHDRITVRTIPASAMQHYEEIEDLSSFPVRELVNAGSNNYGGFSRSEHNSSALIESTLRLLPFNPAPQELSLRVHKELAAYMGAQTCSTTISGFGANVLAFRTVAETARKQGRKCLFLLDSEAHASMFAGAFANNEVARTTRWAHNDITNLEFKLRNLKESEPETFICVAIEGLYSLAGHVSPAPAILALRKIYHFTLFVDSAHDFMAMGRCGRGAFEYWQDRGYDCSLADIDIMTATMSKSVSCIGGFVAANGSLALELKHQEEIHRQTGVETLATVAIVRLLSLIRKPRFVQERMTALGCKARFVADCLLKAGCEVLCSPGSAIICFPVGTVSQASRFHQESMRRGYAVACGVPPATPIWGCRIRVCVFATISWTDVLSLTNTLIDVSCKLGVQGVRPLVFTSADLPKQEVEDPSIEEEGRKSDDELREYILDLSKNCATSSKASSALSSAQVRDVAEAGVLAFHRYGLGSSSVRWFYGTSEILIKLEQKLARLYCSLNHQAGQCRAIIAPDASVMTLSLINSCTNPLYSKGVTHVILLPSCAPLSVHEGVNISHHTETTKVMFYTNVQAITAELEALSSGKNPYHLTLYLQTVTVDGKILDLAATAASILSTSTSSNLTRLKLILDDTHGLGKIGARKLGYLDLMESKHGERFFSSALGEALAPRAQVVVAGSFFDSFGHQGGYMIGDTDLIEVHTVSLRSYIFSTASMPVQAAMSLRALELLSNDEFPEKPETDWQDKKPMVEVQSRL